jgi:hypothetical protein
LARNASEYPKSNRIFFPLVSMTNESPGSPVKYRSVSVVLLTETVRENCGVMEKYHP